MPTRQRLVTYGVTTTAAATITVAALLQPWRGAHKDDVVHSAPLVARPAVHHPVDVVFAVDTTGSMGGLIEGAKRTVWSIASHIRDTDPNVELRIGLVAYRDVGDEYVTRDFALTADLDAVFGELSSYRASGGGDTPEDVDAALDVALHKMAWNPGASKLVFLVGDAPPASRGEVPRFEVSAREAAAKRIIINTIRCGQDGDTELAWRQIAAIGNGQFSTIQQDGGVQQIATPYDAKLAELSARIDDTAVIVGGEGVRAKHMAKMAAAASAPAPAKADRAMYYAKGAGGRSADDLVEGYASGTMDPTTVAPSALPADLRGLDKAEVAAEIGKRAKLRAEAQGEMAKVAKQREEYLKNAAPAADGFDAKVKAAIDAQLKN